MGSAFSKKSKPKNEAAPKVQKKSVLPSKQDSLDTSSDSSLSSNETPGRRMLGQINKTHAGNYPRTQNSRPADGFASDSDKSLSLDDSWDNDTWNKKDKSVRNGNHRVHDPSIGVHRTKNVISHHSVTSEYQQPVSKMEDYPETYAQRLTRENYKQPNLLRQKTIYRNDEDWVEHEEVPTKFDPSRFKEANKKQVSDLLPKSGQYQRNHQYAGDSSPDLYGYSGSSNRTRPEKLPSYNITDEALITEIENL